MTTMCTSPVSETSTVAQPLLDRILSTRNALRDTGDDFVFLAFWDFDGTLLEGDCTWGNPLEDSSKFTGLTARAVEAGLLKKYPAGSYDKFLQDYKAIEAAQGKVAAYHYTPQMLAGNQASAVHALSKQVFEEVYQTFYFKASLDLFNALAAEGIDCHIISASADVYVTPAADTFGLPEGRIHGVKVEVEDGVITDKPVFPVTWWEGKTETLKLIVKATEEANPGKKVVVLGGFGNSFVTDGPFMKHIATSKLPAGETVTMMVNGGDAPEEYAGLFTEVSMSEVVGG